jgi:hypothetical protein
MFKADNNVFLINTAGLLMVLCALRAQLSVSDGFLRFTKNLRTVIFYNKKLKNWCSSLGNKAEPIKYAAMSGAFCHTICEGVLLDTRKSIFG